MLAGPIGRRAEVIQSLHPPCPGCGCLQVMNAGRLRCFTCEPPEFGRQSKDLKSPPARAEGHRDNLDGVQAPCRLT